MPRWIVLAAIAFAAVARASETEAAVITFSDRAAFLAALAGAPIVDDFETYTEGDIAAGSANGHFTYDFDSSVVQPAVTQGAFGGLALGGTPLAFDPVGVFVGGNEVLLTASTPLGAFGADFYYGSAFDAIPAGIYGIRVDDGASAGTFVGNGLLDPAGGSFFLGLIADPGFEFTALSLLSVVPTDVNGDPTFLVPAYQVDNLAYGANAVPEPSTLILLLSGAVVALRARHRTARGDRR
jgi:hypothetical protein